MCRKLFGIIIILFAIILAILGVSMSRQHLQWIILVTNFFDIMIPILAVGALISYISKSSGICGCKKDK